MRIFLREPLVVGLLALVLGSGVLAADAAGGPPAATVAGAADVLAKGKGVTITRRDLNEVYERIQTGLMNVGQLLAPERREQFQAQVLDQIIFVKLCEARATDADKTRARFESDAFVRGLRDEAGDEAGFQRRIIRAGYAEPVFLKEKFLETLATTVVDRELKSKITITDEQMRKAYADAPERWTKPETVRIAQLLVSTRDLVTGQELSEEAKKEKLKTASALRARAEKGEDFAGLVRQSSDDTASRTRGGEYTFSRGQMVIELEAAAFSMKPGQLSDVVTSHYGYHLVKLLEKTPASVRPFDEVKAGIRGELVAMELKKQLPGYSTRLRDEAGLELTALAPKAPSSGGSAAPVPPAK